MRRKNRTEARSGAAPRSAEKDSLRLSRRGEMQPLGHDVRLKELLSHARCNSTQLSIWDMTDQGAESRRSITTYWELVALGGTVQLPFSDPPVCTGAAKLVFLIENEIALFETVGAQVGDEF
jgi:hypothetical protein